MAQSLSRRYLDVLKSSLLNEIYLENEVRLLYIFQTLAAGQPLDGDVIRNVNERLPELVHRVRAARQVGRPWWLVEVQSDGRKARQNFRNVCEFSHTMIGRQRLDSLEACLDRVRAERIAGDLVEAGAWRGGASIFMRGYLAAYDITDRTVWVADSFKGLPKPSLPEDRGFDFSAERMPILAIPLHEVQENFRRYQLLDDQVRFLEGWFRDTLPAAPIERIALARIDGDLYESTRDALLALYRKVVPGGFVVVDDYGDFEPCRRAVEEFRRREKVASPLQTIDWTGVYWRKP